MSQITETIHSIPVDALTGAVSLPIYLSSTFVQEAPGVNKGFDYTRTNNPTRQALENVIATLEGGQQGLAFSSGLAAIDAVLKLLKSGDEIIAVDDIYGGTFRLLSQVYEKFGIKVRYVDTSHPENIEKELTPATAMIWIESPTNPTLKITDIRAAARIAKSGKCLLCVDNTFATPVLQQPLELGADIVVHSATKYIGGHSDVLAGLVVTREKKLGERIKFIQNSTGAVLSPFDSWLVLRGIQTLHLRINKHCENAYRIAKWLDNDPDVAKVYYPGLSSHPNHEVAKCQSRGFGGVVSFVLKNNTQAAAVEFLQSTRLFKLAESLGGVKSLVCHPASMTHKSVPAAIRKAAGVADGLIRLSVGLEDVEDLIFDILCALAVIPCPPDSHSQ